MSNLIRHVIRSNLPAQQITLFIPVGYYAGIAAMLLGTVLCLFTLCSACREAGKIMRFSPCAGFNAYENCISYLIPHFIRGEFTRSVDCILCGNSLAPVRESALNFRSQFGLARIIQF